jgi:ABC-type sugar transport system permease subunit
MPTISRKLNLKNKNKFAHMSLEKRRGLMGYFFCFPFILGLIFIFINALLLSFQFSINNVVTGISGYHLAFKGLTYYKFALFEDPNFIRNVIESVLGLFKDLSVILIYSLFIAIIINQKIKGRTFIRAIFFLPVIIATGIISQIESSDMITQMMMNGPSVDVTSISNKLDLNLFDYLKNIILSVNISPAFTLFISDAVKNVYDIVTHSGVQIIIFLAGLQSISPAIYEAAYVEGCSGWEKFWKITLPLASPLILVNTVWTIVDFFLSPTNAVMTDITNKFKGSEYSLAAAMSFINFIVMGVIIAIILAIIDKFVFYENK